MDEQVKIVRLKLALLDLIEANESGSYTQVGIALKKAKELLWQL